MSDCRIPAEACYWGTIDRAMVGTGSTTSKRAVERIGNAFEALVPCHIEQLHHVSVPLENGTLLVCAIEHDKLQGLVADHMTSLGPESIPAHIETNAKLDPSAIDLLTGMYEPLRLRRARQQWWSRASLIMIVLLTVCVIGLARRIEQSKVLADTYSNQVASMYESVLGPTLTGQPPAARLTSELRQLQLTRSTADQGGQSASPEHHAAALRLGEILAVWPAELAVIQTRQMTVTDRAASLVVNVADPAGAQAFIDAMNQLEQWQVVPERVVPEGTLTRVNIGLTRLASEDSQP